MPPNPDTLRALREGKERIRRGWCKHSLQVGDRFCAIGAICDSAYFGDAMKRLDKANRMARDMGCVARLNDHPLTEKKHILGLYDAAIWLEENDPMSDEKTIVLECLLYQAFVSHRMPWRIEQDWTWEVIDADDKLMCKFPTLALAELFIELAQAQPTVEDA